MQLRFTGPTPTTFPLLGVAAQPGDVLDVPDDVADAYSRRADLEPVEAPKAKRRAPKTNSDTGAAPDPTAKEAGGDVPDDH